MTPRPVWRSIVRREVQRGERFDVLVCGHAVPVDDATHANRHRRCRSCPECARRVAAVARAYERTGVLESAGLMARWDE